MPICHRTVCYAFTALFLSILPMQAMASCAPQLPRTAAAIVPPNAPDQRLMNAAILAFVNHERCRAGLAAAKAHSGLSRVAQNHAQWMAAHGVLSHTSTLSGQSSVQARIMASGYKARRGSENIGVVPHLPHEIQSPVKASSCKRILRKARRLPPQSYAHLAQTIVAMWMKSKRHRRNVLDPNTKAMGSAVSFNPTQAPCGQYYLAQSFAG